MSTEEALSIGLVDRRFPSERLHGEAEAYARELAALSQTSIRGAKAMIDALGGDGPEVGLRALVEAAAQSEDFQEGRAAYAARRKPNFG